MVGPTTYLLTKQLACWGMRQATLYKEDLCFATGMHNFLSKYTLYLSTFFDLLTWQSESRFPKIASTAKLTISVLQLGHRWLIGWSYPHRHRTTVSVYSWFLSSHLSNLTPHNWCCLWKIDYRHSQTRFWWHRKEAIVPVVDKLVGRLLMHPKLLGAEELNYWMLPRGQPRPPLEESKSVAPWSGR